MVDISNPVYDPSRCLVGNLPKRAMLRLKQDLYHLQRKARLEERVVLETPKREPLGGPDFEKQVQTLFKSLRTDALPRAKGVVDLRELDCLRVVAQGCPVAGLQFEGRRIHTPGVSECVINGAKGKITVANPQRKFGGGLRPGYGLEEVLRHYTDQEVLEAGKTLLFTRGTVEGFKKHVKKQMGMPTVKVNTIFGEGRKSKGFMLDKLDTLFNGPWKSLEGGSLDELLATVTTSGDASAGAPYWKDKAFALEEMMEGVMPLLVEALKKEDWAKTRAELRSQYPELFLCELKNMLDRYEVGKLKEKCRPYLAMPFHFSVLFSFLSQNFCKVLSVCDKDWATHNAYGLSAVDGGLEDIRRRMLSLKRGQYDYYCYGDDTDIYYRDAKGVLYHNSPDFSQMDGCVDSDTVYLVVKWIYRSFEQKYGECRFWAHVCQEWCHMALNPEFVCDGPTVYCKDTKHGLGGVMSGVVGTTLFDTESQSELMMLSYLTLK